jgi:P27 family predicted phage terminase small subunit
MVKTNKKVKIPSHLKTITKKWFKQVLADYELEPHHIKVLTLACEAWERAQDCQAILSKEGLTYTDRFGSPHPRPEVKIKEQAEIIFARLLRELCLDVELPKDIGRPPLY